ncbi:unnamed protein product, partial [Symbiodinium necroappetens]
NRSKGEGRCMRFSCPSDAETPFYDEGCATPASQAYCGSHPYFGGYDFDPDDPDLDERCCKPGGVPLFQVAVAANRCFDVSLVAVRSEDLHLDVGVFFTKYSPADDDEDTDMSDVTSFRITCHTGEKSVISCEEISGQLGFVTGATMLGTDAFGLGRSRLVLVHQKGRLPCLLRNAKLYTCEWAGRADIACPDECKDVRFPQQIVHLGSSSLATLSQRTLWVVEFPEGAVHIAVEEVARQVTWRKVLDLGDLAGKNPCLLAHGPRDGQLMIFIVNQGCLPCTQRSLMTKCKQSNRASSISMSIILAEHVWVSPVHDPDEMQRVATFTFTNPDNSAHGVPVASNQRFCLVGMLMRFEYFRKMFEAWSERASAKVDMLDTDVATFDHFMQYAYCGRISDDLNLAMLTCLLRFANKYLLPDLAARTLEDAHCMKRQSSATLAELLLLADEAMHSILCFRGDVLKDASFLATVTSRSSAMLAQLLAPVAPNHNFCQPEILASKHAFI